MKKVASLVALACIGFTGMVHASETDVVSANSPALIRDIAQGYGSATLDKGADGDPEITGRINGTKYGVYFYGCTKGKNCDSIQFSAGWGGGSRISLNALNEWNKNKRYGQAYLDKDGDPAIKYTVNLDYGVTRGNLDDTFNIWTIILKQFRKEVLKND